MANRPPPLDQKEFQRLKMPPETSFHDMLKSDKNLNILTFPAPENSETIRQDVKFNEECEDLGIICGDTRNPVRKAKHKTTGTIMAVKWVMIREER